MRIYSLLLAALVSFPAHADEIMVENRITDVTLFPQGAILTREIAFDAAPGSHILLLTDLPQATYSRTIRVLGNETVTPGAVWLRSDRLFARPEVLSPDQAAAKAVIEAAQAQVDSAADVLAAVQAKIEAANTEMAFLSNIRPDAVSMTPEALTALSAAVAQGVAAARARANAAGTEARPLQLALDAAIKARDLAQQAYDALPAPDADYAALSIAVDVAAQGPQVLTLTQFIADAGWSPVYDMSLTRSGAASLTLSRGAFINQYTGEDWEAVNLTLSTARLSDQTNPTVLYPDYREIFDVEKEFASKSYSEPLAMDGAVAVESAAEPSISYAPTSELQGDVWIYKMPGAVNVASGIEDLRMPLGDLALTPKVFAQAVPRSDTTAFMMAKFTNTSGEVLLPGEMYLYRDGNLVGYDQFPLLAAGDEWSQGFGAIDGLVLERKMPKVSEGDRGLLSSETEQSERATLTVKNLTAEAWAVRMLDTVPYSEQEDLEVTFAATPAPTETDVEGERGILAWEFDLAPGAEQSVELEHALRWPSGMALR